MVVWSAKFENWRRLTISRIKMVLLIQTYNQWKSDFNQVQWKFGWCWHFVVDNKCSLECKRFWISTVFSQTDVVIAYWWLQIQFNSEQIRRIDYILDNMGWGRRSFIKYRIEVKVEHSDFTDDKRWFGPDSLRFFSSGLCYFVFISFSLLRIM